MPNININTGTGKEALSPKTIFGSVAAADYADGDILVFNGVTENTLIRAELVLNMTSPVTLVVLGGRDLESAIALAGANSGTKVRIDYVITYDARAYGGDPLRVSIDVDA